MKRGWGRGGGGRGGGEEGRRGGGGGGRSSFESLRHGKDLSVFDHLPNSTLPYSLISHVRYLGPVPLHVSTMYKASA